MVPQQHVMEEDLVVLDGDLDREQDGPAHADQSVLHHDVPGVSGGE